MILIIALLIGVVTCECPNNTDLTFSKAAGFKPRLPYQPTLLYASSYGSAVTAECYNRCRNSSDCFGFVLVYATASCYRVGYDATDPKFGLIPDEGVTFFSKICLPVSQNCSNMAWSVETALGYEFLGPQHTILSNVEDRWTCIKECLIQAYRGEPCLSANFYPATKTCTLSSYDRWLSPDMFVPSTQRSTEYIDNNCLQELNRKVCWQLPTYNTTSLRADAQVEGLDVEGCRKKCEDEDKFKCRAFSHLNKTVPSCILHSDKALIDPGPIIYPSLTPTIGGLYIEMISCVNLTVSCNKDMMTVTLGSKNFKGVLSVRGYSSVCSTSGKGDDTTSLVIPLPKDKDNKCNVNMAYSIGDVNRTLVSAVVVVQYHELIQRSGDRIVKASCLLSDTDGSDEKNVTLGTGYAVQSPGVQSEVSGTSGTPASSPRAKMSLIDARTGRQVTDVKLGDPLILRIELQKPYNVSNVHVGHLVASSGDKLESLLLLDWNGCPPDPTVFPALSKTSNSTLEAPFKSFRFQSTQLLSLAVVLTFCKNSCPPVDCGNGVVSYGRRRRDAEEFSDTPLELSIMLHVQDNANTTSSPILQASSLEWNEAGTERLICTNFVTAAILALFWLLLQCSILAVCCCVLQKRKEEHADTISLSRDFHPQRHVTFVDEIDEPAKGLRLSTPMKNRLK